MGSRIVINLQSLLSHPEIRVVLSTTDSSNQDPDEGPFYDNSALVHFGRDVLAGSTTFGFDYTVNAGVVELSRDFNFYRPSDHTVLMRELFEHSVDFTVHH